MKFVLIFQFLNIVLGNEDFLPEQIIEMEKSQDITKLPTEKIEFDDVDDNDNDNDNEMVVQFDLDKIYFQQYERLVAVFGQMNQIYNKANSLIPQDEFSEDIFEQFKQKADIFDQTKVFYDLVFGEGKEIQEELNDFLENIDKITLQTMTCLELFGFKDFYYTLTSRFDKNRDDFKELQQKLDFSVQKLNFFAKDSVRSYNSMLDIPTFLKDVLYPFMPLFAEAQPDPGEAAVNLKEFENIYTVLLQQVFNKFEFFQKGLLYLKQYRMKLYYKILEFKSLPEEINEFDLENKKKIVQLNLIYTLGKINQKYLIKSIKTLSVFQIKKILIKQKTILKKLYTYEKKLFSSTKKIK